MPSKTPKKMSANRKIPEWVTDHFEQSVAANETLFRIIHLSEKGIGVIRSMPNAVKVLAKVHGASDDPSTKQKIEHAEREAQLAQSEIDSDFPVLHGLAVVALWSWLEHFVKGFVALWILHRKDALTATAVQKLKVKLGDYLQLQKHEQANYLVDLLEQDLASPLKRGVTRFESILEPFSLSGSIPDGYAQTLFELQQIRNVIAHRNGRVDRRLKSECPWLKLRLNQPVAITEEMLNKYAEASGTYLVTILYRVGDVYGQNLRPDCDD